MNMTDEYIAGFTDGEGCIRIYNLKNGRGELHRTPTLILVQSEKNGGEALLRAIREYLGYGTVSSNRRNDCWRLDIRGGNAVRLCIRIRPHTHVKSNDIDKVIEEFGHLIKR